LQWDETNNRVNVADAMQFWTSKALKSTRHRVLIPPTRRFSIAYFVQPDPDTVRSHRWMLLTVAAETHQCRTRRKCEGANCPRTSFQTNPHCNGSNRCWRSYVRIVEDSQCYKMPDLVSTHNLQMYTSFITYDISWCFPVGFDLDGIRCLVNWAKSYKNHHLIPPLPFARNPTPALLTGFGTTKTITCPVIHLPVIFILHLASPWGSNETIREGIFIPI